MTKTLAPFVYWAQTESEVLMRVDLKDVEEPTITLGKHTTTYWSTKFSLISYEEFLVEENDKINFDE